MAIGYGGLYRSCFEGVTLLGGWSANSHRSTQGFAIDASHCHSQLELGSCKDGLSVDVDPRTRTWPCSMTKRHDLASADCTLAAMVLSISPTYP